MKKIGKPVVQNIPVPLPSIALQKAITAKLDSLNTETPRRVWQGKCSNRKKCVRCLPSLPSLTGRRVGRRWDEDGL